MLIERKHGVHLSVRANELLSHVKPINGSVVDPFAGNGDLLVWASDNGATTVEGWDIRPVSDKQRDSLTEEYSLAEYDWVVTNPPYLLNNKTSDKSGFVYGWNDLYKNSIHKLIVSGAKRGIIIIPANFLHDRDDKFRKFVYEHWDILSIKEFTEPMFEHTDIHVVVIEWQEGSTALPTRKTLPHARGACRVRKPGECSHSNVFLNTTDNIRLSVIHNSDYVPKMSDRTFVQIQHCPEWVVDVFNNGVSQAVNEGVRFTNFLPSGSKLRMRITFREALGYINHIISSAT